MNKVEQYVFFKRENGIHEVSLRADAPENSKERSIHLGLVIGKAKAWVAESSHRNVLFLGKFKTRELAADRLLALAKEQGRVQ